MALKPNSLYICNVKYKTNKGEKKIYIYIFIISKYLHGNKSICIDRYIDK